MIQPYREPQSPLVQSKPKYGILPYRLDLPQPIHHCKEPSEWYLFKRFIIGKRIRYGSLWRCEECRKTKQLNPCPSSFGIWFDTDNRKWQEAGGE